jgi:hypothetical protein
MQEDTSEESQLAEVVPSGLSKCGFRPTATHRDLKVRLYSRSSLPPHRHMTRPEVEKITGARIPESLWDKSSFRYWLLQLHPNAEWAERVDYLSQLLLDRIECVLMHGDDKHVANLAKIIPDLAGKVKRAADRITDVDQLATMTEAELLQIVSTATARGVGNDHKPE